MKVSFHHTIALLALPGILTIAQAQDNAFDQEEPTAPPTSQFQGPETGYIVPIPEGNGAQINQDRIVDFAYCYGALDRADVNSNGRLERAEYENFAQDFGTATECLGTLERLPLDLLTAWNQLSCECRARGGASDCCLGDNGNIPISGVGSDDEFIVSEQQYLRQVCLRTDQLIVTYCTPPPPPIIPPPPPAAFLVPPPGSRVGLTVGMIILGLFLILPWRRRCFLVGGAKDDDDSSDDSSEDAGGMRHMVTEAGGGDLEEGDRAEPDDDARRLMNVGEEEDGEFGGTSYGRTIQEPEYEEEGRPKKFVYEQYELPKEPEEPIKLKPIPVKTKTEEDEPYDLEHYIPDGGIVQYEREGEWRYDADGGWTPEERATKDPTEWKHKKYERAEVEPVVPVDNRQRRVLDHIEGGEIFDLLDQDNTASSAGREDMFDWVIQSALNTFDERVNDLQGSVHSSDDSSRDESESKNSSD